MKRLISWLLALTLICGLLPMSVFAAETDVEIGGDSDFEVDMWELQVGGSAENRLLISFEMNAENTEGTASVTVPAGKTLYVEYKGDPSYKLTVDGAAHEFVAAAGRFDTNKFEITNATEAEKTYELKIALPVGTNNNPKVIEEMNWYSDEVTQTLGDFEGYYYIYTAAENGDITLYFNAEYDDNGEVIDCGDRDIKVTNLSNSAQKSLLVDGVDYYGLQLVVPVEAGKQYLINTSWVKDAAGNMYPAGTYTWTGNFTYPAGSDKNPIDIEWTWDDAYANATASVTVPEGATQYFTGKPGMILTVDGTEVALSEDGTFTLTAGTHELKLATPVGAYNNPEVIELPIEDTNSLEADANYNYVWTATEDGTVTLDITDGANITVNKVIEISEDGWPVTEQFELATVEYDDNWNASWVVAENLVIEVVAGQQLNIQVNGLTDWETWSVPAIDYTLTGSFEAAEQGPIEAADLVFYRYALSFQEYTGLQFIVKNSVISGYERVYAHVSQNAPEGVVESDMDYTTKGNYSYFNKDILSWSMTEEVTITLYGEKEGKLYVGQSVTTSVMEQALLKVPSATAAQKTVLIDMLNYGAAVQTSFNHNPENLPNADVEKLGYAQYATQTQPTLSAEISAEGTGSVAKYRDSLSLQSKVELQVIFKLTSFANKDVTQYKAEVTMGGNTTTIEGKDFRPSGTSYSIVPVVFAPYMLRETCTVVIKDLAGNVVSPVYTYSVEGLAKAKLNGTSADDVIYAMMKFGDAVSALM